MSCMGVFLSEDADLALCRSFLSSSFPEDISRTQSGPSGATAVEQPCSEGQAGLTALLRTSGRDAEAAVER